MQVKYSNDENQQEQKKGSMRYTENLVVIVKGMSCVEHVDH